MKQIVLCAAAGFVALSVAGCAVEVPLSAFQLGPLDAEKATAPVPQSDQDKPAAR